MECTAVELVCVSKHPGLVHMKRFLRQAACEAKCSEECRLMVEE